MLICNVSYVIVLSILSMIYVILGVPTLNCKGNHVSFVLCLLRMIYNIIIYYMRNRSVFFTMLGILRPEMK